MSDTAKPKELTLAGRWLTFLKIRHEMEDLIKKMELTDSSLSFGIQDEQSFRDAVRQLDKLLDQVKDIFGPEKVNPLVA